MTNFNYEKIHERFMKDAQEKPVIEHYKGFGVTLLENASNSIKDQIEELARSVSTPGYALFLADEEIDDAELDKKVRKVLENKKASKKAKAEKEAETVKKEAQQISVPEIAQVEEKEEVEEASKEENKTEEKIDEVKLEKVENKEVKEINTVYASKKGTKYHKKECMYMKPSFEEMSLEKAIEAGKVACTTCFTE